MEAPESRIGIFEMTQMTHPRRVFVGICVTKDKPCILPNSYFNVILMLENNQGGFQ